MKIRELKINFKTFNLNFFILSTLFLILFSISKGILELLNFSVFFVINSIVFLAYFLIFKKRRTLLDLFFFVFMTINYALSYVNIIFAKTAISMNYNFADLKISAILFFIKDILGFKRFTFIFLILLLIYCVSIFLTKGKIQLIPAGFLSKKTLSMFILIIFILIILIIQFNNQIYNPYLSLLSFSGPDMKISIEPETIYPANYLEENHNDNFNQYNIDGRKYQYAFVFVMEQTSLEDFYEEKALIQGEDFFDRVEHKTHFFTNYYTSNQDSRTAIWEMLNSFFIPFECYIEPWQDYYGYILETNNLISYLKSNGVEPYSVSSIGGGSLILGIYPFNSFIRLYDYEKESQGYLCSTEFSYQKACEDFAIFDNLTQNILENKEKDLFYFQELIFGHGEKYMDISGKQRVEYYNDYFNEFYSFLEDNGIAEKSLIVIVADHGPKGGRARVCNDFNIPLMIIADDLNYSEISNHYSHFSFKDIFLSYCLGKELPAKENFIYLIDQSGRNMRGYIDTCNNNCILGNLRGDSLLINGEDEDINVEEIQEKIRTLLAYQKYVKKLSLENHTYMYIP